MNTQFNWIYRRLKHTKKPDGLSLKMQLPVHQHNQRHYHCHTTISNAVAVTLIYALDTTTNNQSLAMLVLDNGDLP